MLSCLLNNKIINTFEYDKESLKKWSSKNILKCPVCGNTLEYCHGKIKIPYFRHKDKINCPYSYTIEISEEHKQGVIDIYNWIKTISGVSDVGIESWIPETKQRPDIKFRYNGDLYVIEYQCSPISSEYYERHELYKAAGINDIWILGAQKYFQKYHKGYGDKKICEIERNSNMYYDPIEKSFYDTKGFSDSFNQSYINIPNSIYIKQGKRRAIKTELKLSPNDNNSIFEDISKYKDFNVVDKCIYYQDNNLHFEIFPDVNKYLCVGKRGKIYSQKTMPVNIENLKKYIRSFIEEVEYIVKE